MRFNYRSEDKIKNDTENLIKWMNETIDIPVEGMSDFFENRINDYESVHLRNWENEYKNLLEYLPDDIGTLLDIGCGTGLELDVIFKKLPSLQVTGIDICESMLNVLKNKHPGKDVKLIQADYFEYPFESRKYDAVISVLSLHHYEYNEKQKVYDKI